jgi:hypothetical protein
MSELPNQRFIDREYVNAHSLILEMSVMISRAAGCNPFYSLMFRRDAIIETGQLPKGSCIRMSAPSGAEQAKTTPTVEFTPHLKSAPDPSTL